METNTPLKMGLEFTSSLEAMEIGFDVGWDTLRRKVLDQFTTYAGEDSVFPTKNGSPKILTKFVDHPYSYGSPKTLMVVRRPLW